MRIGLGYDVHKLVENRELILGGVKIEHSLGLAGHSDADVLIHAVMDAMLGALALGDIGKHFPDTDNSYKNIDSRILLKKVMGLIEKKGYKVGNVDAVIAAQKPKLAPYIDSMRANLAKDMNCDIDQISIKATTTEGLGFEGREEGISSSTVVLLIK